jgi:hypothetical protein
VSCSVEQEKLHRFHSGHGLGQNGLSVIVHWRGGAGPPLKDASGNDSEPRAVGQGARIGPHREEEAPSTRRLIPGGGKGGFAAKSLVPRVCSR